MTKSIEQLENDVWKEPIHFPSNLVINCYKYRKIPIDELTIEQLRVLISQQIGLKYILGIVINKLEQNILSEGDFYEGDLLMAVSSLPTEVWTEYETEFLKFKSIVEVNSSTIKYELGIKDFEKIKASVQHRL